MVLAVQLFNKIKRKKKKKKKKNKEKKKTKNMKKHEKTCFNVFPGCYVEIHLSLVNFFWYVLDIDITRNGNNLKLKVKYEFS